MIPQLLQVLSTHPDGLEVRKVYAEVAEGLRLTQEEIAQLVPSQSQALYKNRIGWAQDSLKRVGWSASPAFGVWKITPAGTSALKEHPSGFTPAELKVIGRANASVKMADLLGSAGVAPALGPKTMPVTEMAAVATEADSPDDLMQKALAQIRASVEQDVLERLRQVSSQKFEILVLDLLHAMGYGLSRESLKHVGGSGDGGIDGIVPLDRLGLNKVYVQAKRWQNSVGSPEIQTFIGALQLHGADRGVLMTSGDFSKPAFETATRAKGALVLIDGTEMARLMVEFGVGAEHKAIKVPALRADAFEE